MSARPGIHPEWASQNGPAAYELKYSVDAPGELQPQGLRSLLQFCVTSGDPDEILRRTAPRGKPFPGDRWWSWLSNRLDLASRHTLDQFQARTLAEGRWDHVHASATADAMELAALMLLRNRMLGYQKDGKFFIRGIQELPFAVTLLLVEGQTERALGLANAGIGAINWSDYQPTMGGFTSSFLFALLGDYLGRPCRPIETPVLSPQAFNPEPVFQRLLASWRSADPQEIEARLLEACDCHTQLAWSGDEFEGREFTNGFWPRVPLAVLAVAKLRELQGFATPQLQHPLTETALGRLPAPGYVEDPVLAKLRQRADRDGLAIAQTLAWYRQDRLPPQQGA